MPSPLLLRAPYRTGRWRSSYTLDLSSSPPSLSGSIQLHVHFFEQGNVQLTTSHTPALSLPESLAGDASPADVAKVVLKTIKKAEEEYQMELNEAYREMSDKTFRNLRRALPVSGADVHALAESALTMTVSSNTCCPILIQPRLANRSPGKRWTGPRWPITSSAETWVGASDCWSKNTRRYVYL